MRIGVIFLTLTALLTGAELTGRVADQTDAIVAGAQVEVRKSGDPLIILRTIADDAGRFRLAPLAPGDYELIVRQAGFKELTLRHAVAESESATPINVVLQIGPIPDCQVGDAAGDWKLQPIRNGVE